MIALDNLLIHICKSINQNKMHVSRMNINLTNGQLRKRKFQNTNPHPHKQPPNTDADNRISLAPLFSLQCNRLDQTSPYQRLIFGKLAHLQSLSENKYSGTPQRKKNTNAQDKVRRKIMEVIEGYDLCRVLEARSTQNVSPLQESPRKEHRFDNYRLRPATVDILRNRSKRRSHSAFIEPCQIAAKPLLQRPVQFFQTSVCPLNPKSDPPQQVQQTINSPLPNKTQTAEKKIKDFPTFIRSFTQQKTRNKSNKFIPKDRIPTPKPNNVKRNQQIRPWDSFELQQIPDSQ